MKLNLTCPKCGFSMGILAGCSSDMTQEALFELLHDCWRCTCGTKMEITGALYGPAKSSNLTE